MNPASTVLLARYTPPQLRSRVFSFKQTAVPIAGTLAGLVTPRAATTVGWRGAIAALGVLCLALSVLIQPWRAQIDDDGPSHDRDLSPKFWLPMTLMATNSGIRSVTIAAFAFGALQFSFVSVFPTVLAHVGWSTTAAGRAMSVALVMGVVLRVPWGTLADKVGSRPILAAMGGTMSLASIAACFLSARWSALDVTLLAGLFGVSAFCWSGIGIAEAVRHVPPELVPEASAGIIGVTFFGALAGPTLFSTVAALAGTVVPAFAILGGLAALGTALMLRPLR
jgi:nitrate/nitrite transporter NarK